jgi:hypothetical protein
MSVGEVGVENKLGPLKVYVIRPNGRPYFSSLCHVDPDMIWLTDLHLHTKEHLILLHTHSSLPSLGI